ncbi:hypothetical protein L202_00828 [Cryptococcus amylolentus CBS 6039]|uniref:Zn(2)-C6 fungal-type domain-containing protein n=1 Tax=Cryptococcus amylolentus CBS 6039 TaxID=1295533 RepID=A0A1E3I8F1_9TREE|nr:hypothetical protein L202_00828 [Cryptococcus amylolentus CBS 6039]ODN84983.1 hypothetical protein L202_00828 [Cryptococcus amylolentus CBS 6039]
MPKDDPAQRVPLRRGDACQYCRKRRIRCSADKPSCQHCLKSGRECIYDIKKPTSRVQQLEDKVAQLESLLKRTETLDGQEHRRNASEAVPSSLPSSSSLPAMPIAGPSSLPSTTYSMTNHETVDVNLYGGNYPAAPTSPRLSDGMPGMFPNFGGGAVFGGMEGVPIQGSIQVEKAFDFSTLDPTFMGLVNSFQNSTGLAESFPQPIPAPYEPPPRTYSINQPSQPQASYAPQFTPNPSSLADMARAGTDINENMAALLEAAAQTKPEQWNLGITSTVGGTGVGTPEPEQGLVGGWFDAGDLPKIARDHLLDVFFSGMRLFGQEFHVPRFMASLSLPPTKRPHPCLLYAMYTMASRLTSSPSIRQLESHFYSLAITHLATATAQADRLMDATRAGTILAAYTYSKAMYHEGWLMTGQAARLAISCGLHQIKGSVWRATKVPPMRADLAGLMRHRSYILAPPKDAVEHGERIWAFWSVFVTDRCGSIATQWYPSLTDDMVTTPFPRPIHEYELGLVSDADDVSIASIFSPTGSVPRPMRYDHVDLVNLRIRAITILERSSKLMYLTPEAGWDKHLPRHDSNASALFNESMEYLSTPEHGSSYRSSDSPSAKSAQSSRRWTKTARIRTPKAYESVKRALLKIEEDLPEMWRTNWLEWDGKVHTWHFQGARKDLISLHLLLGCSWMFLEDVFAFNVENTAAVNVAKRLTVTVKYLSSQMVNTDLDVFVVTMLGFISKILIRELKRLQSRSPPSAHQITVIESEVEVVVHALKHFGRRYGSVQAIRTERYRESTAEEVEFMKEDDDGEQGDEMIWAKEGLGGWAGERYGS